MIGVAKTFKKKRCGKIVLGKPRGTISDRVRKVGGERFGIVAVDCGKARSKLAISDFYGRVLLEPLELEHTAQGLAQAAAAISTAAKQHQLLDLLVAVEMTGKYHRPVQRALGRLFEVRLVHPLISKAFRRSTSPGVKTDWIDLGAITLAAVNGFALLQGELPQPYRQLQLLVRYRRDLVNKTSLLRCQILEHLHAAAPGFGGLFADFWEMHAARAIAWELDAAAISDKGVEGLSQLLRSRQIRFIKPTLRRIVAWAGNAAQGDALADQHRAMAAELDCDRLDKERRIVDLERRIASLLVQTPYVLLLSVCGINVVSAAEYAGEAGPITQYANSRCLSGRAGLYPSRYQSEQTDMQGSLVRCANHRLRYALTLIAGNLLNCNDYFGRLAETWRTGGKNPRATRVKIANRFARISFRMLAAGRTFHHPAVNSCESVLRKLTQFATEHQTPAEQMLQDMRQAMAQLRPQDCPQEHQALQTLLPEGSRRRRGPMLREILPEILVQLAARTVQSTPGGADPA